MASLAACLYAQAIKAQGVLVDIQVAKVLLATVHALRIELITGREEWLSNDDVKGIKSIADSIILTVKREAVYHQRLHDHIVKS